MKAYTSVKGLGLKETFKTSKQGKGRFNQSNKNRGDKKRSLRRIYKKAQRNILKIELDNIIGDLNFIVF